MCRVSSAVNVDSAMIRSVGGSAFFLGGLSSLYFINFYLNGSVLSVLSCLFCTSSALRQFKVKPYF